MLCSSVHKQAFSSLAQVFGCPIGGSLVQEQWAVDGSGSTYIWAALDDGFK